MRLLLSIVLVPTLAVFSTAARADTILDNLVYTYSLTGVKQTESFSLPETIFIGNLDIGPIYRYVPLQVTVTGDSGTTSSGTFLLDRGHYSLALNDQSGNQALQLVGYNPALEHTEDLLSDKTYFGTEMIFNPGSYDLPHSALSPPTERSNFRAPASPSRRRRLRFPSRIIRWQLRRSRQALRCLERA